MGRLRAAQARLRHIWRRLADWLSVLQNLWAAALVTALFTVAFNAALAAGGWALPAWTDPVQGFVVFAIVSGVGFLLAREQHRDRLRHVAAAATDLLEVELGKVSYSGPTYSGVNLRSLARAADQGKLVEAMGRTYGGPPLAARVQEIIDAFQRATSHDAGELSPPRANTLVAQVIRHGAELALEMDVYVGQQTELLAGELRYNVEKRHAELEPRGAALATPLRTTVGAAEGLEELADPHAARRVKLELASLAKQRSETERELQQIAATAGAKLLEAIQELATSSEMPQGDLATWRANLGGAQRAFRDPVAGRGGEMHPRTHRAFVTVNDAINDLDNAVLDLVAELAAEARRPPDARADALLTLTDRRQAVRTRVDALIARIEQLRAIRLE